MRFQGNVLPSECKTLPTVHHSSDRQVAFRHSKWPRFSNLRSKLLRPFRAVELPRRKDMASAWEGYRSDRGSRLF